MTDRKLLLAHPFALDAARVKPVRSEEAQFLFVLLNEPEKGRVDIQLICDDRIKPIETVEAGEIEPATET